MPTIARTAAALFAAALALSGCSDSDPVALQTGGTQPSVEHVIATEFALGGESAQEAEAANRMVQLYLTQQGDSARGLPLRLETYDTSTADEPWDAATCARNAQDHVGDSDQVAVVGAQHSGCSKVLVPVLNQHPSGPMLVVSPSNTDPGLTAPWARGEPDIYYPTGSRNYVRLLPSDEDLARAAAQFMAEEADVSSCSVLHDNEIHGRGVADAFVKEARRLGLTVVDEQSWDPEVDNYSELFELVAVPKPDCLFIGGAAESNAAQLMSQKVEHLGSNDKVLTIVPAAFSSDPDFAALEQNQDVYITDAGLDLATLISESEVAAALSAAYEQEYEEPPPSGHALYAVAATQVVLAALEGSDGSRGGLNEAVFGEDGLSITAEESAITTRIAIDPETGESNNRDVTILQVREGNEDVATSWRVR